MSTPNAQPIKLVHSMSPLRYGLLGLPLSLVALSIYVHFPAYYAREFGFSLASLGALLLLTRLFDMAIDPWLGRVVDALFTRHRQHIGTVFLVTAATMFAGFTALWAVPATLASKWVWLWLTLALLVVYASYSFLHILHLSWAGKSVSHLNNDVTQLNRLNAGRELSALLGVLCASAAPLLMGIHGTIALLWAFLVVAVFLAYPLLRRSVEWFLNDESAKHSQAIPLPVWAALNSVRFQRLLCVFVLNALASAIPGTLMIFFSQDVLQSAAWTPYFLITYFACAALAVPVWLRGIKRFGLVGCWLIAMVASVALFVVCLSLGAGQQWWFLMVSAATGFCLGADLLVPPALLVNVVKADGAGGEAEGSYFAWWTAANKLALALSAGLTLPLLGWWGYTPNGTNTANGLLGLSLVYALIPCVLKLLAAFILYKNQSFFKGDTP